MNIIVEKLQKVIDSGNNPRLSGATIWEGKDGRIRIYWGGDAYLEYKDGEWSGGGGIDRKAKARRLTAIQEILETE